MRDLKCSCVGCDNLATHTWSGHPTCDSCGSPRRINKTPKPFDITKHEFSDDDLSVTKSDGGTMWIDIEYCNLGNRCSASALVIKQDAIAIARALGVTGEDLK